MNINLKQNEIESAIKGYVLSQGISLNNKEVSISFTAGRKNSGISAEITIEDSSAKPTLICTVEAEDGEQEPLEVQENVEDTTVEEVSVEKVTPKTTSLFG